MGQLGLEGLQVVVGREVVLGLGPRGDRVDDAVDELPDAGLALRRAEVAAEVLADDDVGGQLAPEVGDLDVLLLEDRLAGLVGDAGGPVLPGDLVVGVDARAGPAALEGEALGAASCRQVPCRRRRRPTGRRGGGSWGPCRWRGPAAVFAAGSLTSTVLPVPRAISASPPVRLQSRAPSRVARRGRCAFRVRRASRSSWGPLRTGGLGRRGACRWRLGEIRRPHERYACREASQAQKHKM